MRVNTHTHTHTHTHTNIHKWVRENQSYLSCRCVRMTYWWWTSWTAYQVRGSVSTGEVSLRKRRQWWTAFPWWHNVPSPVQLLSSTSSGLREPGHTCGTHTQVHEQIVMAENVPVPSEEKSLLLVSGYFSLRPFVSIFTQMSLLWPTEPISLPLPPRKSDKPLSLSHWLCHCGRRETRLLPLIERFTWVPCNLSWNEQLYLQLSSVFTGFRKKM